MAVYLCVRVNTVDQPGQSKGPTGKRLEAWRKTCTHCCLRERGRGEREADGGKNTKTLRQGGERSYPSVPGLQPSAQIRPKGAHSLYTCSNQLATTTCLCSSVTLRLSPTLAGLCSRRLQLFGECMRGSGSVWEAEELQAERRFAHCQQSGETWQSAALCASTAFCIVCSLCSEAENKHVDKHALCCLLMRVSAKSQQPLVQEMFFSVLHSHFSLFF